MSGPRFFFLPTRVGTGGSHLGAFFCACQRHVGAANVHTLSSFLPAPLSLDGACPYAVSTQPHLATEALLTMLKCCD